MTTGKKIKHFCVFDKMTQTGLRTAVSVDDNAPNRICPLRARHPYPPAGVAG